MKYLFSCVVLLLFVIILLFGIETISRYKEMERQLQIERFENQKKIEAIEKEIRLLKTDMEILQKGYE